MKKLLIFVFFNILAFSCMPFKGLISKGERNLTKDELPGIFPESENTVLYKAKISFADNYFSGLLFLKRMQDQSFRAVFTTETGVKIFDFEFKQGNFTKQFALGAVNKNFVANLLANDIRLLLPKSGESLMCEEFTTAEDSSQKILRMELRKGFDYYFIDKSSGKLSKRAWTLRSKCKAEAFFTEFNNEGLPEKTLISHRNFPLSAEYIRLKR